MKIKILNFIAFISICAANLAYAQSKKEDPLSVFSYLPPLKQVNFYGSYQRLIYTNTPAYNSYGISLEGVFGKHLGFEVGISGGKGNFQTGIGIIVSPIIIMVNKAYLSDTNDLENYILKSLYVLLFLEHINYHINLTPKLQLIPYVSLLRMTYLDHGENREILGNKRYTFIGGGAAGLKVGFIIKDKWLLNGFCEWDMIYSKRTPSGIQAGLNLGISLPGK